MLLPRQFAETNRLMFTRFLPDSDTWDAFVARQPRAHILQTTTWAALKSDFGWRQARVALADDAGTIVAGAQLLFRRLPALPYTLAYLGKGPYGERPAVAKLWPAIHSCARAHRAAFLKWEPDVANVVNFAPPPDFRLSAQSVQPPRTILVDISGDEASILARMNQGTRRKIRHSSRELQFREGSNADIPAFFALLEETARRNGFGIHPLAYYERAASLFLSGRAALILAEREGQTLAGVMVFALGRRAWYFYGASSAAARTANAGYGAQWAAVRWARERGCLEYDLWGVPDEDPASLEAQFKQRSDGLWGVYGFKRGWGGQITRSVGTWDCVYQPLAYAAFRAAYALRRKR